MVSRLACTVLLIMAVVTPTAFGDSPVLSAWGVGAKDTGATKKTYDSKLTPVQPALKDLPFDTFTCNAEYRGEVALGQEVKIPVSGRHTLYLKPEAQLPDGRLLLSLRVEMPAREVRGKPVEALKAQVKLIPGKLMKVQGFHIDGAELIIVLRADFRTPAGG